MLPTKPSYKSAARATTSTTASRLQLASSTPKSSGPCYLSKTNNKPWWLTNTGIKSSDPKWPFSRLICHFCISDTRPLEFVGIPFVGMGDQADAQLVWRELRWHLPDVLDEAAAEQEDGLRAPSHADRPARLSPGLPPVHGCSNTNQTISTHGVTVSAPCRANAAAPKDCNTRLRFNEENGLSQLFAPSIPPSLPRRYLFSTMNEDKPREQLTTFPWPCLDGWMFSQHKELIQKKIHHPKLERKGWPQTSLVPRQWGPRGQHLWKASLQPRLCR